jgi:UDPglucose--hexose-1-phosphate uridylyltransferase
MPKDFCPFCPKYGKVPDYDVYAYNNDFPALSQTPPETEFPATELGKKIYKVAPSYGKCEVILYSPDHTGSLCLLPREHIVKLVNLWIERFNAMASDKKIKYVFPFENRGDKCGTTMPHPHGQMYGFSVMPKKMELELDAAKTFKDENGKCLFCAMIEEELAFRKRIVYQNDSFIAYMPFFADYAYGVYIASKAHLSRINQLDEKGKADLADVIKVVLGSYDELFDYKFPYMMTMHNGPVNSDEEYPENEEYFHFHIELYPPMRSADKQQFMASSETGIWAHCNPTAPEEKAAELRAAVDKFLKSGK